MKTIIESIKYLLKLIKIFDTKTPSQLIFFVTNKCNSKCRHCFYWKNLNTKTDELTLGEIKNISKNMGQLIWLFLSGGEPFMRTDLVEICQTFYLNNNPRSIVIPTNGLLVDKIVSDSSEIAKNCPNTKIIIQVSVDEIGKKHDELRGVKGNFKKVEEIVKKLRIKQNKFQNLAIQANIVFSKFNQDSVRETYDYLDKKLKVDNVCLSLIRGDAKEVGAKNIKIEKYLEAHHHLRKTKRFKQYQRILSYLITKKEDMQIDIFLKSMKFKEAIIPCLSGKQSAVLLPNGDLTLCELRKEKFGNLRDVNYDFSKLWNSKKADQIRKKVVGCYCTQECVYTTNVFLNPKAWPMFLKYLIFNKI